MIGQCFECRVRGWQILARTKLLFGANIEDVRSSLQRNNQDAAFTLKVFEGWITLQVLRNWKAYDIAKVKVTK